MQKDIIDQFFYKKIIRNENTKKSYRLNIQKYFKTIGKNIDTYFSNTKPLKEYENDLYIAYESFEKKRLAPLTIRTNLNSVKQFLFTNDKRIKDLDFWDILKNRMKGSSPISKDFIPNTEDIKTVLQHGNTLSRAMYLIMSSTGCRIGELIALYPEDIDINTKPATINIRRTYSAKSKDKVQIMTKTKKQRTSFLTNEAKESYIAWLKEREKYLASSVKRTKYDKDPNDKRVFPMSDENARTIWEIMVKKSGLYKKDSMTDRATLHPHCLRKFFRSYLGHSDLAEHLMGHATGMDKYYRNMKKEDLANQFLKFENNITILEGFSDNERINDLDEQLHEKSLQIKTMQEDMQILKLTLQSVQNQLDIEKIKNGKK